MALNEMPAYRGMDTEGGRFSWEKLLLLRFSFAQPPPPTERQWLQVWEGLFAYIGALGEPTSLEPEHLEAVCHTLLPPDPREHSEVGRPDPGNGLNCVTLHTNKAFSQLGWGWGLLLLSLPPCPGLRAG